MQNGKIIIQLKLIFTILWKTILAFFTNNCFQMSAALSYYALLSLAPLALVAVMIAGIWWDESAASDALLEVMNSFMGRAGTDVLKTILNNARPNEKSFSVGITGLVTLVFGASAVFLSLHDAMNFIWKVEPRAGRRFWSFLRRRIIPTVMMGVVGLIFILSLFASAVFSAIEAFNTGGWISDSLWAWLNYLLSFFTSCLLFACFYKFLPDVQLQWKDVFWSALGAGVLFTLGKFVFGSYLGKWDVSHTYGAASSVIVFLIWVYYSSLIIFFGAQFTRTRLSEMKRHILPAPHARWSSPTSWNP